MRTLVRLLAVTLVFGVLAPLAAVPAHAATACVDWMAIPDNTLTGDRFRLAGFRFRSLDPMGYDLFVNNTVDLNGVNVHGLQFPNAGLIVALPKKAESVDVEAAAFAAPDVTIRALDTAGVILDTEVIPNDNVLHMVTLDSGTGRIARLRFSGGGGEGIVQEICSTS